jgi:catechol 2,3-dioxygenase-like lactoylglutathione lyase family enzyme
MSRVEAAVPVLQVSNVEQSIKWYGSVLGFEADPFPPTPPHSFAILRRDSIEIMLQCAEGDTSAKLKSPDSPWAVYLRLSGGQLLSFAEDASRRTRIVRGPERAFYGQVEFEVVDPDGHLICLAEPLPATTAVPARTDP